MVVSWKKLFLKKRFSSQRINRKIKKKMFSCYMKTSDQTHLHPSLPRLSVVEKGAVGGGRQGGAPAPVSDIHAPRLPRPRKPLDEAVVVLPEDEAHQQHVGPARPRKTPPSTVTVQMFIFPSAQRSTLLPSDHPALHAPLLPQVSCDPGRQSLHRPLGPLPDLLLPRDHLHRGDRLPEPKGTNRKHQPDRRCSSQT